GWAAIPPLVWLVAATACWRAVTCCVSCATAEVSCTTLVSTRVWVCTLVFTPAGRLAPTEELCHATAANAAATTEAARRRKGLAPAFTASPPTSRYRARTGNIRKFALLAPSAFSR